MKNQQTIETNQPKTTTKKVKISKAFKPVTKGRAKNLLDGVLINSKDKTRRLALAGLIASIADPAGNPDKFETAQTILQLIFAQTPQFETHFTDYLNRTIGV